MGQAALACYDLLAAPAAGHQIVPLQLILLCGATELPLGRTDHTGADAVLAHIAALPFVITRLRLASTPAAVIRNGGIAAIARACQLKGVLFAGMDMSDALVGEVVRAEPALRRIVCSFTSLSDAGFDAVTLACTDLRFLGIGRSLITDTGLAALGRNCRCLTTIWLNHTKVTDAGVAVLASGCPQLRQLSLSSTTVTDDAFAAVAACCSGLQLLRAMLTDMTHKGFIALVRGCPKMSLIEVSGTLMSDSEWDRVLQTFPSAAVDAENANDDVAIHTAPQDVDKLRQLRVSLSEAACSDHIVAYLGTAVHRLRLTRTQRPGGMIFANPVADDDGSGW
jgi:hypothetical protein